MLGLKQNHQNLTNNSTISASGLRITERCSACALRRLRARLFCGFFLPGPRGVCPSCTSKRSLLFVEKVLEIVHPLNHRHVTFTIPKLLRGYLRRIRRLGKLLLRSAWEAWQEYLHELLQIRDGLSGGIFCLQTQGCLFNFHPHVHALVLPGLVREGRFHELKGCSVTAVTVRLRARYLTTLKIRKPLTPTKSNG